MSTSSDSEQRTQSVVLFLCGDVMTGRGIDQILPYPSDPKLHEGYVKDARDYVRLAERVHGAIPKPVDFEYVWGDALAEWRRAKPDARIINLETSVTTSDDWQDKGINYRMHPKNVGCLSRAGVECCVLSNNHVLDWGQAGLVETLKPCIGRGSRRPERASTSKERALPRWSLRADRAGCWCSPMACRAAAYR